MKQTPNYKLNKLEGPDTADLTQFNPNWDALDTNLKQLSDDHAAHKAETASETELGHITLQQLGMRSVLINGGFDIWQRGTSFTPTGKAYFADRWFGRRSGNVLGSTFSRQGTSGKYRMRVQRDSGNTGTEDLLLGHVLESASSAPLAGKKVTLSFVAKRGADYSAVNNNVVVAIVKGTGIDESVHFYTGFPTGSQTLFNNTISITTTETKYDFTVTLPNDTNQIMVRFIVTPTGTAGANDWYEISKVQLEEGEYATPFEQRPIGLELALCQRYYCKTFSCDTPPNATRLGEIMSRAIGAGTNRAVANVRFPVEMRIAPTVTFYSPNSGAIGKAFNEFTLTDIDAAVLRGNSSGMIIRHLFSISNYEPVFYHFTADAEL